MLQLTISQRKRAEHGPVKCIALGGSIQSNQQHVPVPLSCDSSFLIH